MIGDSRIERPRGVRSARRSMGQRHGGCARDSPGSVQRPCGAHRNGPPRAGGAGRIEHAREREHADAVQQRSGDGQRGQRPGGRHQIATRRGPGARRYRAPSDTPRTRAGRPRSTHTRRGQPLLGRRLSVGAAAARRRSPPQHRRQHADHRDDEDEDQREELPAPPVADGQVQQARRQRREPDDHGHEQHAAADQREQRRGRRAAGGEPQRHEADQRRASITTQISPNAEADCATYNVRREIGSRSSRTGFERSAAGSSIGPTMLEDRNGDEDEPDEREEERARFVAREGEAAGGAERRQRQRRRHHQDRDHDRQDLLDGHGKTLERVARAGLLHRVDQHAPAQPRERPQGPPHLRSSRAPGTPARRRRPGR